MWGKEKLLVQAISPFPTMFSKGFYPRPIKEQGFNHKPPLVTSIGSSMIWPSDLVLTSYDPFPNSLRYHQDKYGDQLLRILD